MNSHVLTAAAALALAAVARPAPAQPAAAPSAPPPPPYSLPWLLRPAAAATVVRFDSTLAAFEDPVTGRSGSTFVESFTASYRATPRLAPLLRVSLVHNDPPAGRQGTGFSNPALGVTYTRPLKAPWRLGLFGAATVPTGSGGGDDPDPGDAAALAAAVPARSAMDNALFAVNYFTVIAGATAARVTPGLTLQAEATVFQLTRVRGPHSQDGSRTNFTAGLHAGRFFGRRFSVGGELRLQRWMTDAAPVRRDPNARETLTAGLGARFHWRVGKRTLRPGLSWSHALDKPLETQGYDMFQLDVPIAF